MQLGLAMGDREPFEAAARDALNPQINSERRIALLGILADVAEISLVEPLLKLIASDELEFVRIAALKSLGRIDDPRIAPLLIELHRTSSSAALNSQIRDMLFGRQSSAKAWLQAVDRGDIAATITPIDQVQRIALLNDPQLDVLVKKHWGQLGTTREEKLAEVRRLSNDLRAAGGNVVAGQSVFKKQCATCHQLFGEGTKLGPDLTTANRKDRDFMLISLVDPNCVIRKEFTSFVVQTKDGRVLTGMAVARDDAGVTLINAKNEKTTIAANDIEELHESQVSLMPDDLYRQLKPQDLRDLFSYLESNVK